MAWLPQNSLCVLRPFFFSLVFCSTVTGLGSSLGFCTTIRDGLCLGSPRNWNIPCTVRWMDEARSASGMTASERQAGRRDGLIDAPSLTPEGGGLSWLGFVGWDGFKVLGVLAGQSNRLLRNPALFGAGRARRDFSSRVRVCAASANQVALREWKWKWDFVGEGWSLGGPSRGAGWAEKVQLQRSGGRFLALS